MTLSNRIAAGHGLWLRILLGWNCQRGNRQGGVAGEIYPIRGMRRGGSATPVLWLGELESSVSDTKA
jgi:hypothetical protein